MTITELQTVITESGKTAQQLSEGPEGMIEPKVRIGIYEAAQWMQVKVLAEIALQLRLMNDGNGARQPGE